MSDISKIEDQVLEALKNGNSIVAARLYREAHGCSIEESFAFIKSLQPDSPRGVHESTQEHESLEETSPVTEPKTSWFIELLRYIVGYPVVFIMAIVLGIISGSLYAVIITPVWIAGLALSCIFLLIPVIGHLLTIITAGALTIVIIYQTVKSIPEDFKDSVLYGIARISAMLAIWGTLIYLGYQKIAGVFRSMGDGIQGVIEYLKSLIG